MAVAQTARKVALAALPHTNDPEDFNVTDANVENRENGGGAEANGAGAGKPDRETAEAAVRTLLQWIGEDPDREGLVDTPKRVVKAYEELFAGYNSDPEDFLRRTFSETEGYDEMVILRDIRFESHCEHHMLPVIGRAHVAYLPDRRVIGISKLARLVEVYGKRLQIQERMTTQIATAIHKVLEPKGVAVVLRAAHQCMTCRGVHKPGVTMTTSHMIGAFRANPATRQEFLSMVCDSGRGGYGEV